MKAKQSIRENVAVIISLAIFAFLFLVNSPLHPWIRSNSKTDSSVFRTVAMMMDKGYMPYKDSFDHKGPLLYIIDWIGNKISLSSGIWMIEFGCMIITLFMIYKIARLSCKISSAWITMAVSSSLLFGYFWGGNLVEEYAMPLIAIGIYIFLDYFLNDFLSKKRLMVSGFCLGAVLLLRPNMMAVWMVFCLVIFGMLVLQKKWEDLVQIIIWFLAGMALMIVPVLVWLAVNGDLVQFWKAYIVFNREYTAAVDAGNLTVERWKTFLVFLNTFVQITGFVSIAYNCTRKSKILNIAYGLYMLLNLGLICMSGRDYEHYGMIIVPAVAYPISLIFSDIERVKEESISRAMTLLVGIYMMGVIVLPVWITAVNEIPEIYMTRSNDNRPENAVTIAEIIDSNTDEDQAISVYGNWDYIYIISNRKHATRYSFQFPIGQVDTQIMEEYLGQLQQEEPPVIVIQNGYYDDTIKSYLDRNQYRLEWAENVDIPTDGALVYMK